MVAPVDFMPVDETFSGLRVYPAKRVAEADFASAGSRRRPGILCRIARHMAPRRLQRLRKEIVLPQLWNGNHSCPILVARDRLIAFLRPFDCMITVVTDAPEYDCELFCELAYNEGKWPQNVYTAPTNALSLNPRNDGSALPHHALLDVT